jgi:hypothetical protein
MQEYAYPGAGRLLSEMTVDEIMDE